MTHCYISEPYIKDRLKLAMNLGNVLEEFSRILHGHLQNIRDTLILIFHFQGLPVISLTLANLTRDIDIGKEVHLNLDNSIPAAGFTAAALNVEAEAAFLVAADLGLIRLGEQITNIIKDACIRRRIGTRRTPDWRLVNINDLLHMFQTFHFTVLARANLRPIQITCQCLIQNLVNECRLP
ncbi:hypothetical protein D3C81_1610530 [compost metagenome]